MTRVFSNSLLTFPSRMRKFQHGFIRVKLHMTGMEEVSVLVEENENRFSVHGEINNSLLMVVFSQREH